MAAAGTGVRALEWLPDLLVDERIPFSIEPDFLANGRPYSFDPWGAVWHHTASPVRSTRETNRWVVRNGNSVAPGPIANMLMHRTPVAGLPSLHLVSAGRTNNAGSGWWPPGSNTGNGRGIGLEWVNDGVGEPAHPGIVELTARVWAVIFDHLAWPIERLWTHRAYAPSRKIDPRSPLPKFNAGRVETWTLDQVRSLVTGHRTEGTIMRYHAGAVILDTRPGTGRPGSNLGPLRPGVPVPVHVPGADLAKVSITVITDGDQVGNVRICTTENDAALPGDVYDRVPAVQLATGGPAARVESGGPFPVELDRNGMFWLAAIGGTCHVEVGLWETRPKAA